MGNKITCLRSLPLPTASNGCMSIITPINLETPYKGHHHISRPSGKKEVRSTSFSISFGHYEKLHWVKYSKTCHVALYEKKEEWRSLEKGITNE